MISASALRRASLVLLTLAVIAGAAYGARGLIAKASAAAEQIDKSAYQVVFLTTGQAFYGKLATADSDTYLLTDVFYLTNDDNGQPTRLLRRGSEVFGPREPMVVSARQVLFFENLRDDSDLVKGIRAIKAGQATPAVPAAPTPPAASGTARPTATR